jgi:hypothetical protein
MVKRLTPDKIRVGDKINGHEEGWLTVLSIDRGGSKYKPVVYVEVETAEGIKTLDCVKHPWGWSDEFEVVRLHESATNNIKYKKAGNTMVRFKESYNGGYDYITSELVEMSGNKLLANAYDRNELSVVVRDNVFWLEQMPSRRVGEIAIKEVKRLFPELIYFGDIHIEGKRRLRSGSRLTESANDKNAIIQKFEDYGFYQDDPSDPRYFYDEMPFRFYATYNSEDDVAYIDFNPAGNAEEVYYANINSVDDADAFLQKLYDWEEYNVFDLLEMGLIAFGFRKDGAWSYIGQNDFGEDIRVDFNADEITLLDDGYGEEQTLSIFDGFDEFIAR